MSHDAPAQVMVGDRARLALRFTPATIRLHIPGKAVGSYLLLDRGSPIYIGRSNRCLRRRLGAHPLLGVTTHVAWETASSPELAFLTEAFWFNELHSDVGVLNAGSDRSCPYCCAGHAERMAFLRALQVNASTCSARSIAVLHMTDIRTGDMSAGTDDSDEAKGHCNG